jgi:iron complex transport system permease protein
VVAGAPASPFAPPLQAGRSASVAGGDGRPRRPAHRRAVLLASLLLALLGAAVAGTVWGAVSLPAPAIAAILAYRLGLPVEVTWSPAQEAIVWQLRLPRVIAGALVGAALATSGALFQGLFRNPMADPFVLGISSGAAFGATLAMALPILPLVAPSPAGVAWLAGPGAHLAVPLCAFAGALGAALLVAGLARRGGRLPVADLLLTGFAVAAMLGAGTTFLLVVSDRLLLRLRTAMTWLAGGIAAGGWEQLTLAGPVIVAGILLALLLARWLDAFLLGEEGAATVGVPVELAKQATVLLGALLTAAAVTMSGLIGFVGLLVPHAVRLIAGPAHAFLLPASALGGATFLIVADLLARTILAPVELPVGILTALVGGPLFLVLLRRTWRRR